MAPPPPPQPTPLFCSFLCLVPQEVKTSVCAEVGGWDGYVCDAAAMVGVGWDRRPIAPHSAQPIAPHSAQPIAPHSAQPIALSL